MSKKVVLVWFRNDLRLHDNEVLVEAINKSDFIIPVYCFDPRYFAKNKFDQNNTGIRRARFLLETVNQLKSTLQKNNSDLMTFVGYPEEILPKLCVKYDVDEVFHHREVAQRETKISEKVEASLWDIKINLRHFIGHTLYHKEDLPFPIKDIPDKFNVFRKKIERESSVRKPIDSPSFIPTPVHLEKTALPSLSDLGYSIEEIESIGETCFHGGENEAIERLNILLDPNYIGTNNYTFISPYIALGSLSPIYSYHKILQSNLSSNKKRYERIMTSLLLRDYYRFMLKKHPNIYFRKEGSDTKNEKSYDLNDELFYLWKSGNTGEAVIDRAINSLKIAGNITYAERQMLARFYLQEIGNDWLKGASFFEEYLLDYAPATTYGFWSHMAGVGTSEKENDVPNWQEFVKRLPIENA